LRGLAGECDRRGEIGIERVKEEKKGYGTNAITNTWEHQTVKIASANAASPRKTLKKLP
jgi:hypothetical protein